MLRACRGRPGLLPSAPLQRRYGRFNKEVLPTHKDDETIRVEEFARAYQQVFPTLAAALPSASEAEAQIMWEQRVVFDLMPVEHTFSNPDRGLRVFLTYRKSPDGPSLRSQYFQLLRVIDDVVSTRETPSKVLTFNGMVWIRRSLHFFFYRLEPVRTAVTVPLRLDPTAPLHRDDELAVFVGQLLRKLGPALGQPNSWAGSNWGNSDAALPPKHDVSSGAPPVRHPPSHFVS